MSIVEFSCAFNVDVGISLLVLIPSFHPKQHSTLHSSKDEIIGLLFFFNLNFGVKNLWIDIFCAFVIWSKSSKWTIKLKEHELKCSMPNCSSGSSVAYADRTNFTPNNAYLFLVFFLPSLLKTHTTIDNRSLIHNAIHIFICWVLLQLVSMSLRVGICAFHSDSVRDHFCQSNSTVKTINRKVVVTVQ